MFFCFSEQSFLKITFIYDVILNACIQNLSLIFNLLGQLFVSISKLLCLSVSTCNHQFSLSLMLSTYNMHKRVNSNNKILIENWKTWGMFYCIALRNDAFWQRERCVPFVPLTLSLRISCICTLCNIFKFLKFIYLHDHSIFSLNYHPVLNTMTNLLK